MHDKPRDGVVERIRSAVNESTCGGKPAGYLYVLSSRTHAISVFSYRDPLHDTERERENTLQNKHKRIICKSV